MNYEVEKHLGLVTYVMNKEFKYFINKNPDYKEDLYQEGSIGLWIGVRNYDESRGAKKSSFLYHTIKCNMLKFVTRFCKKHEMLNTISLNYTWGDEEKNTLEDILESRYFEIDEFKMLSDKLNVSKVRDIKPIMKLYIKGKKQKEIGKELHISQMTVCRRIQKFKAELIS